MELQDIKNLEQAKVAEARKLQELSKTEKRGLKAEELSDLKRLLVEADGFRQQYETELQIREHEAGVKRPYNGEQPNGTERGDGKFKSFGEFVQRAVMRPHELRAMGFEDGDAGGFAVPDQFSPEILSASMKDTIMRPRAMVIPAGTPPDAKLDWPALKQGTSGIYGGVTFTAVKEGTAGAANDPKLDLITLEPQRFSGYVMVGNALLRNAPAMSGFLTKLFGDAKAGYEDLKFIKGAGVSEPLGLLNSPCKLNVARNTSTDIKNADVLGMMALQYGDKPFWLASKKALPKIAALADANNNAIYIAGDASKGLPPTLYGLPLVWSWRQPTLGSEGDLMLVDASYYLIKDGSGPYIAASEHVAFTADQTAVKLTWYSDGQPWVKAPILMEDGTSYASPIVVLL